MFIEMVGDRLHPGSLEVLGQARRLGSALGATVYALIPCATTPRFGENDFIAVLSRAGADKVLMATSELYAQPARWGTHGALLLAAFGQLAPTLVLLAATECGADLGARAAAHLGAALLTDAWVDSDAGGLVLFDGSAKRACRLEGEIDFPVLAMIPPGRYLPAAGDEEAEVEVLTAPALPKNEFEEIARETHRPAAVIIGSGAAAEALAFSIDGALATAPGARARVAIAILPTGAALDELPLWRRAATRIALGAGAADCATARYAVDGDGAALASELALAVTALRQLPEPER